MQTAAIGGEKHNSATRIFVFAESAILDQYHPEASVPISLHHDRRLPKVSAYASTTRWKPEPPTTAAHPSNANYQVGWVLNSSLPTLGLAA